MSLLFLDPCRAYWERALRLPPRTLAGTMLWELQTYYHLPREEVTRRCRTATNRIAEAWRRSAPRGAQDVQAFYRQPLDYAFELLWWHSFMAGGRSFLNVLPAVRYAYRAGARRTLDFGGGVGSHAIVMAAHGLDVALADVSEDLLAFAAWRARLRARAVGCFHLDRDPLADGFDFVVALDVLEHLPAPAQTLVWLCDHLRDGGWLFISMPTDPSIAAPQHISFWGEQLVIEEGLEEIMRLGNASLLFRKVGAVRASGAAPRYVQTGRAAVPLRSLAALPPVLWWTQNRRWRWASRTLGA